MAKFDELIDQSTTCDAQVLQGVLLHAIDGKGADIYKKASGCDSASESAGPISFDSTLRLNSSTKLVATIAALQCVERGLITLDEPLDKYLPELTALQIVSDDAGTLRFRDRKKPITLHHLLTHTSGCGFSFISPTLKLYHSSRNEKNLGLSTDILADFTTPLLFEPGEGWSYSPGLDWAGLLIERLHGGIDLEEYVQTHICAPLGMESTTFRPQRKPGVWERLVQMAGRKADADGGGLTASGPVLPYPAVDCCGGSGLFSSVPDFMRVLLDLLQPAPQLLRRETVNNMFRSQLQPGGPAHASLMSQVWLFQSVIGGTLPEGVDLNFGLAGVLTVDGVAELGSMKGTMAWGGAGNTVWFVNREAGGGRGLAAFFGAQMMPSGDKQVEVLIREFIKEVWRRISSNLAKL